MRDRGGGAFSNRILRIRQFVGIWAVPPQRIERCRADERARGISAGLVWGEVADATVVYVDRGISGGMRQGN
jgi:hypothetical protein